MRDVDAGDLRRGTIEIRDIDYSTFKLLHLSILWRAGVASSRPFESVNLGTHEGVLRRAILTLQAPPANQYAICAFVLRNSDSGLPEHAIVMPPTPDILAGVDCFNTMFSGRSWYYFLSQDPFVRNPRFRLSDAGTLWMPIVDFTNVEKLRDFVRKWKRDDGNVASRSAGT